MERATELEYLRWFFCNVDLAPDQAATLIALNERFKEEHGKLAPEAYIVRADID